MTPRTALAEVYGAIQADDILAALKRAGLVVVDKGAIGRAQREAVVQYKEDIGAIGGRVNNRSIVERIRRAA